MILKEYKQHFMNLPPGTRPSRHKAVRLTLARPRSPLVQLTNWLFMQGMGYGAAFSRFSFEGGRLSD
jgi:hypothetical protein